MKAIITTALIFFSCMGLFAKDNNVKFDTKHVKVSPGETITLTGTLDTKIKKDKISSLTISLIHYDGGWDGKRKGYGDLAEITNFKKSDGTFTVEVKIPANFPIKESGDVQLFQARVYYKNADKYADFSNCMVTTK